MIRVRTFVRTGLIAVLLAASCAANAQPANGLSIQQQLQSYFTLTRSTADGTDVVTAGAVLVLQKDNLLMCKADLPIPTPNVYKNGEISQAGLLGALGRMGTLSPLGGGVPSNRKFVAGEKFWVTRIDVQSDGVVFLVLSDPFQDVRYHGTLRFPFAKGASPDPDQLVDTIAQVLKIDGGDAPLAAQPQPAAAPAPDTQTKTIALGQTRDQVLSVFGQPAKVVQLGAKEIDYYSDMKVTFVRNKVTNVE